MSFRAQLALWVVSIHQPVWRLLFPKAATRWKDFFRLSCYYSNCTFRGMRNFCLQMNVEWDRGSAPESLCLIPSRFYCSPCLLFDEVDVRSCLCCAQMNSCSLTPIHRGFPRCLFPLTWAQKGCGTSLLLNQSLWIIYFKGICGNPWMSAFQCKPPEKAMATHSSTHAWKIPWMEEPGGLQSMESLGIRHDWVTSLSRIGEGNGNPLQCSCLENPRDSGAW